MINFFVLENSFLQSPEEEKICKINLVAQLHGI
jgi:hypothetical protein